jgi:hypothetical protein
MKMRVGERVYTFDQSRMLNTELMVVERETGFTAIEWQDALNRGSMIAVTALIWIVKRRYDGDPTLAFDKVVFDPDDIEMMFEDEESGKDSTSTSDAPTVEATNGTGSSSSPASDSVPGSQIA